MRGLDKSPQSLAARAIAGFPPVAENGTKAALTTGMTTDRKIFIFTPCRGIMAEIEYPGVAQLVGRDIWDVEVGCSSHLTRTKIPLKLLISEGFFYSSSIAAQGLMTFNSFRHMHFNFARKCGIICKTLCQC